MDDEKQRSEWMAEAIALAVENVRRGGGPFGAVVVKDGVVVARGANAVTVLNDPTAHAEVMAIRAACQALGTFELAECDLYASCEPCPMCLGAIYWARMRCCYWAATRDDAARAGFDDALIYRQMNVRPEERIVRCSHLLVRGSCDPFEAWVRLEQKRTY